MKNTLQLQKHSNPGFGTLLTINIIFEVQLFFECSVVKIPAWRIVAKRTLNPMPSPKQEKQNGIISLLKPCKGLLNHYHSAV